MSKTLDTIEDFDLILVDTLNVASIAFYSKQMLSYNGKPTGMVYGTLNQIKILKRRFPTASIVFLWEGFNSIRKVRHPFYKAQRKPRNDVFLDSLNDLRTCLAWTGVWQVQHAGVEADDLACFYCRKPNNIDKRILLVSNDYDWWGFVTRPTIGVWKKNSLYTQGDMIAELGYDPAKLPLFKVLHGDASDNIRGIEKLTSAQAVEIVKRVDNLDALLAWDNAAIQAQRDIVLRNAELILFHPEWIQKEHLQVTKPISDPQSMQVFLEERGMKSLYSCFNSTVQRV